EQLLRQSSDRRRSENFSQHRGRDLAAAAAAVAELGQANLLWSIHRVRILRVKPAVPVSASLFTQFDSIVDARSPAEYAEDHIPGAVSAPALDDAERATVGTLYKQVSPFDARKLGAALLAKNVARHVETLFRRKNRHSTWRSSPRIAARSWAISPIARSPRRNGSRASSSPRFRRSIPLVPSMSKARAARSARCRYPRRSFAACAPRPASCSKPTLRPGSPCSSRSTGTSSRTRARSTRSSTASSACT